MGHDAGWDGSCGHNDLSRTATADQQTLDPIPYNPSETIRDSAHLEHDAGGDGAGGRDGLGGDDSRLAEDGGVDRVRQVLLQGGDRAQPRHLRSRPTQRPARNYTY